MTYDGLINICNSPKSFEKITVIEGPDSSGKSYLVNQILEKTKNSGITFIKVRCPDNRNGANFRDVIMSEEIGHNPSAQLFLFVADMIHAFESIITPHLDDPNTKFIFDRFLPSTIIYQKTTVNYINYILGERYPEFTKAFAKAHYIYLTPRNMESHKERISKKAAEEINHLDPISDEDIKKNILDYCDFSEQHKELGILGSKKVDVCYV